eukprot:TRINITY_DN3114_c0_g2_i1.p1 TRINITY_DN3114_c0_g2~~TRINITY_DN3114_c0_g2_i1.p1  ORF type:complete len:198 (-),score=17.87 TRINITY_DN3114_c0_g2_i1:151-744(-)
MLINAKCDDVMKSVIQELGLKVPAWRLKRVLVLDCSKDGDRWVIEVGGLDEGGLHIVNWKSVLVTESNSKTESERMNEEPFRFVLAANTKECTIELESYGHYDEPICRIEHPVILGQVILDLFYDPPSRQWSSLKRDESPDESPSDDSISLPDEEGIRAHKILNLEQMGFDREASRLALAQVGFNLALAIDLLINTS